MDVRRDETVLQPFGGDEVVDPPSRVLLPCFEAVGPPGIDVRLVGMEVAEGVYEAASEKLCHLAPLLVGEAGVVVVGLRVLEVDLLVCDIQVAAEDDRLVRVQPQEVSAERILPLHAVGQACQLVLGIGRVDGYQVKVLIFQCNDAPFLVMLLDPDSKGYGEWFLLCKDRRAAVALLLRVIPVLMVARKAEVDLPRLQLALLNTEKVRIQLLKGFHKVLIDAGTKAVDVP